MIRIALCVSTALILAACGQQTDPSDNSEDLAAQAVRIAQNSIIIDTHVDVPFRLQNKPADVSVALDSGDFDYPRAVAGGLNAPFMSIYTPAELEEAGGSFALAETLIDLVSDLVEASPDKFEIALTASDVSSQFERGLMSLPMGMENGSPIDGKLENVQYFYDRGIRYITLTHGLSNHISDSSYDDNKRWGGLSEFGENVVHEMNRVGIMVDVSHVSDDAFWDVMEITDVPAIASHSSARHFTPGFERNMSDEMIVRLAQEGGTIMINFGSSFLTHEALEYSNAYRAAGKLYQAAHPEVPDEDLMTIFRPIYVAENGPLPYATLDAVLDHVDHVVALAGVDHVGIGSDFDGVGDSLPIGLKDVSDYPNLVRGLLERGYSEADIRKVLGENLLRVWNAVEIHAAVEAELN